MDLFHAFLEDRVITASFVNFYYFREVLFHGDDYGRV
jgi:hypothetical protein